jgi:hypothetical protein
MRLAQHRVAHRWHALASRHRAVIHTRGHCWQHWDGGDLRRVHPQSGQPREESMTHRGQTTVDGVHTPVGPGTPAGPARPMLRGQRQLPSRIVQEPRSRILARRPAAPSRTSPSSTCGISQASLVIMDASASVAPVPCSPRLLTGAGHRVHRGPQPGRVGEMVTSDIGTVRIPAVGRCIWIGMPCGENRDYWACAAASCSHRMSLWPAWRANSSIMSR